MVPRTTYPNSPSPSFASLPLLITRPLTLPLTPRVASTSRHDSIATSNLPTTPPPHPSLASNSSQSSTFTSPSSIYPQAHFGPSGPGHIYSGQQLSTGQLGVNGIKGDVWLTTPSTSNPPSPSTIDSTSDSQTGEYLVQSSSTDTSDDHRLNRNSSLRQRHNLSLSIPSAQYTASVVSPSSLASSGAPFTDSVGQNTHIGHDYFQFDEASLPSATESHGDLYSQSYAYRLPASQPSSPVRGCLPVDAYAAQPARQRGATFSGGYSAVDLSTYPTVTIPTHLAFTAIRSPTQHSSVAPSIAASPILTTEAARLSEQGYFATAAAAQLNAALGAHQTLVGDHPTPTGAQDDLSTDSSTADLSGMMAKDLVMSNEMQDKAILIDKILNNAQQIASNARFAKDALLRGEDVEVSNNLNYISTQLEAANELQVPPSTGASTSPAHVSPVNAYQQPPNMAQPGSLLPPLPVEAGPSRPQRSSTNPAVQRQYVQASPTSEYGQHMMPHPPPLIHAHSYPITGSPQQMTTSPISPLHPSQSFAGIMPVPGVNAAHAPVISSPLANMPVSRAATPPSYQMQYYGMAGEGVIVPHAPHAHPQPAHLHSMQDIAGDSRRVSMPEGHGVMYSPGNVSMDGRPVINRSRSASLNKGWSSLNRMTQASTPPSAWASRPATPYSSSSESDDDRPRQSKRRRSAAGKQRRSVSHREKDDEDGPDISMLTGPGISEDVRRQLDQIFEEFLNRVCSDLEVTDSKGEKLHQVLMPKKMQRLDESPDYRPFKFRIQAFTNAFHEELQSRGITEETMSSKKIKMYLWRQDLIARFNADGKKAKSKGNHIWNIEAKRLPSGTWVFRPFKRKIMGQPQAFAQVNEVYEWEPKIWDPQCPSETLKPQFHSPPGSLPSWLSWEDGLKLTGIPREPSVPFTVVAMAEFNDDQGNLVKLDTSFSLQAVTQSFMPIVDPAVIHAQNQIQAQARADAQAQRHEAVARPETAQPQVYAQPQAVWDYGDGTEIPPPIFGVHPHKMGYPQPQYQ